VWFGEDLGGGDNDDDNDDDDDDDNDDDSSYDDDDNNDDNVIDDDDDDNGDDDDDDDALICIVLLETLSSLFPYCKPASQFKLLLLFVCLWNICGSCSSAVGIVTVLQAEWSRVQILVGERNFSILQNT
jgi:hypothetical protein